MPRHIELTELSVPNFGMPAVQPVVSTEEYESRITNVRKLMAADGLTHLVVYGDREHFPNLMYLTGFDPRFEEGMLILGGDSRPHLLVGNEGYDYAKSVVGIDHTLTLYQSFSLLGQWRDYSRPLPELLAAEGIKQGARVGTVGWKSYDARENSEPLTCIEIPAYIIDALREATGRRSAVINVTDLFTNPSNGLRSINSADQLAVLEFGATFASQGVRNMTEQVVVGKTELAVVEAAKLNGLPLSCHPVVNAGPRSPQLGSPMLRELEAGDPFMMAIGVWGGLSARAGFVVEDETGLDVSIRDYVEAFVKPYYAAAVDWYETVGIGVAGGDVFSRIGHHFEDRPFHPLLNPGHLIHLDEWVHSSIQPGAQETLRSGMALQLDIIPVHKNPDYFTTNVEDGIGLADGALRDELAQKHPDMWARVQARRKFMKESLGINIREEVLPFSNMPGVLRPYLLTPQKALRAI